MNWILFSAVCLNKTDFQCRDNNTCVPNYMRCNGESDCKDNSDEVGCPSKSILML